MSKTGAGKRDKHITIQSMTEVLGIGGQVTPTAATFCKPWASIEPLTAREAWREYGVESTITHRIGMTYISGITTRHQMTWNGRTFRFESVMNPDEANRDLIILATEVV